MRLHHVCHRMGGEMTFHDLLAPVTLTLTLTLIRELDLYLLKMYSHTKNEPSLSELAKVRALRIDRQTRPNVLPQRHSRVVMTISRHPSERLFVNPAGFAAAADKNQLPYMRYSTQLTVQ